MDEGAAWISLGGVDVKRPDSKDSKVSIYKSIACDAKPVQCGSKPVQK
jgi:hypothetical protein